MFNKVYIEITNICNKNCSFCHGHSRPPRQMTEREFLHILAALSDQTGYLYYHLMGEPLTHPLLPAFIRAANERGYKSIITTNGTLLPKRGEALLAARPHKVSISLHGFEEDDAEGHAAYIAAMAEFAQKAADLGIIVVLRLWNKGYDSGKNQTVFELLQRLIPGEWAENTRGMRIRHKLHLEWGERFAWPDREAELQCGPYHCYGLKDQFGILCDGTVVPCCLDSDGVIGLGNVFEQDLGDILSSPRALAITEGFARGEAAEDLCKRCGYARRFVR